MPCPATISSISWTIPRRVNNSRRRVRNRHLVRLSRSSAVSTRFTMWSPRAQHRDRRFRVPLPRRCRYRRRCRCSTARLPRDSTPQTFAVVFPF